MPSRFRMLTSGLGLAFALTSGIAPAWAGFNATVTGTATSAANSLTLYSYTVTDLASSTENVGEFDLVVPANANLTSFSVPNGYIIDYTPGNVFLALESPSPSTDLIPGNSETFSFLSPDRPGLGSFTLLDYNTFNTIGGSVVAPAMVPEPGTLALVGIGMAVTAAMLARRRSRKLVGSPVFPG